ncbi:antibiotic biosynthesis monooxygenase [Nonomuraea sp. NBC_01738]|uniref:putative quinol monooxygenase n=1 Tax=Nonomuraea sp. NBC_01738 TaxID=2976003 RepID=UPI002E1490BA|nr:antibiotic biosynthesis monooxygenase [Nonomuraea sp. NBC_01738]
MIAWSIAAVSLCIALGAVGTGYLVGFGEVTFRLFQLGGSLLAPLWMALGLILLLVEKITLKFGAWLFGIAFTVVAGAVLLFDPVLKSSDMGKAIPFASTHWGMIVAGYLLVATHVIVGLLMLTAVVVAALRWRNGDDYDTDNLHATLVIAPSAIALVGALRFTVPGIFTTALLVVAAAAIWYSVLRPLAPYEDDEEDDIDDWEERPSRGRRAMPEAAQARMEAQAPVEPPRRRSAGLGDLVAEYRAGDQEVDYAARMDAGRMEPGRMDPGPSTGYIMSNGQEQDNAFARHGGGVPHAAPHTGPHRAQPDTYSMPGTGGFPGAELFAPGQQQSASSRPSPSIFGLLTVFTLMDGSGDLFDRLADQTVEAVRRGEPDTLVYACHSVKSAPLQRIVYELYRDEVAYQDHQRQPHVERFVNERQAMVLATNVIELNVNAAKVVPLPTAMF